MARPSRTKQRDRKVQPPRPPNAWILYRSHQFKQIRLTNERLSQASVSKIIADMWRNESEEVKRHFEQEAETKKAQHQALYPGYRFCPKRKEPKQSQKKSKCRDATPSDDANNDEDGDDDASPPVPAPPSLPLMAQPPAQSLIVPGYRHNMVMPQSFMIPHLPGGHYGSGGPSPPMSAAPSPAPHASYESPPQSRSASSSSIPSTRPSPSAESQVSSSSSQLSVNPMYLPSLPNSHHSSPNPYGTLPLSTHIFQNATQGQLPPASPLLQLRSAENTVGVNSATPVWNNISTYLPSSESQNSEEVVNLDLAIPTEYFAEFQQAFSPSSSYDSLHGVISRTDQAGVFNLSNIESSALLNYPDGALEVAMGPNATTVDYNEFSDIDLDELQRTMDAFAQDCTNSAPLTSHPVSEDFQSLFQTHHNPDLQAYTAAQQRQPSAFTQDMMSFFNFEAAEESTQNASCVVPTPSTTVAPRQVNVQRSQAAPAMPVFTQMTNTPITSGGPYVPPAGAMYSSTRRVAASWKPPFVIPHTQMDESVSPWNL